MQSWKMWHSYLKSLQKWTKVCEPPQNMWVQTSAWTKVQPWLLCYIRGRVWRWGRVFFFFFSFFYKSASDVYFEMRRKARDPLPCTQTVKEHSIFTNIYFHPLWIEQCAGKNKFRKQAPTFRTLFSPLICMRTWVKLWSPQYGRPLPPNVTFEKLVSHYNENLSQYFHFSRSMKWLFCELESIIWI